MISFIHLETNIRRTIAKRILDRERRTFSGVTNDCKRAIFLSIAHWSEKFGCSGKSKKRLKNKFSTWENRPESRSPPEIRSVCHYRIHRVNRKLMCNKFPSQIFIQRVKHLRICRHWIDHFTGTKIARWVEFLWIWYWIWSWFWIFSQRLKPWELVHMIYRFVRIGIEFSDRTILGDVFNLEIIYLLVVSLLHTLDGNMLLIIGASGNKFWGLYYLMIYLCATSHALLLVSKL